MEQLLYSWSGLTSSGIHEFIMAGWGLLAASVASPLLLLPVCFDPARPGKSLLAGLVLGGYTFLFGVLFPLWYDATFNLGCVIHDEGAFLSNLLLAGLVALRVKRQFCLSWTPALFAGGVALVAAGLGRLAYEFVSGL
jgi:hypothetical protein